MMSHSQKNSKSGQSGQGFQKQRQGKQSNGNKYHYNALFAEFTDLDLIGMGREVDFCPERLIALCCSLSNEFTRDYATKPKRRAEFRRVAKALIQRAIAAKLAFAGKGGAA